MKALVLAGSLPQIELIKNLKNRGYYCILADYTEHPPAEKYADKFYRKSTLDVEAITNIAISEKVDLLFTVCTDQALNTVAEVSEKLGLPCYINAETGRNVTNKKYMKQVFSENGIPTAKFVILDRGSYEIPDNFSYPLIVKPVDCNSSKGVRKVTNKAELNEALDAAFDFSRTNNAIVEEYIQGQEVSVDIYVHNGKPRILCVSNSDKIKDDEKFIIFRSVVPANIADGTYAKIQDAAEKIVKAFNLKECPMLIQLLYKDGEIYIIEFSARTGGGLKFKLINQNSGIDIIDNAVNATLSEGKAVKPEYTNKFIINEFIYAYDGVYKALEGFGELKDKGVIYDYFALKTPGTEFKGVSSSGDRIAAFTIIADTYEELNNKYIEAHKSIKVINSEGKDMMRHDLTYPVSERKLPGVGVYSDGGLK